MTHPIDGIAHGLAVFDGRAETEDDDVLLFDAGRLLGDRFGKLVAFRQAADLDKDNARLRKK